MFSIFDTITRELLGKYGQKLLDIFLSNSFVICTIVVIYGTILILAQKNMEKIEKKAKSLENSDILACKDITLALASKDTVYWEQLYAVSRFPFIALSSSFLLYRITPANIRKLLLCCFLSQQRQAIRTARKK